MTKFMAIGGVVLMLAVAGCAKQPASTTSTTPAPSGDATTTGRAGDGMRQGGTAGTTPGTRGGGSGSSQTLTGAARPSVTGFQAVPELTDVYFEYDKAEIRDDDAKVLDANAKWLREHPSHLILIEGHCDERGTNDYNLALGDRRARATTNYLISRGVPSSRITNISYGEQRPVCGQHSEDCFAKNRRAHFMVKPQ